MHDSAPTDGELSLLAVRVAASLLERGLTVGTAESCTGGYVAKLLTDIPGSSRWFESGFITYSNDSKRRELGVSAKTLAEHGAVSEQTVLEMAIGALAVCGVDRGLAISGVAGPDGGTEASPVGTVWFGRAVRMPDGTVAAGAVQRRFEGGRDVVRRHSAAYALILLLES